jgi:DNA-binding NtrC family response regulator
MTPLMLIVDDEPRVFQALRRTLHRENLELVHAASGEEAIDVLSRMPVDIVLADENMPGMVGTQLLAIVRQRWPDAVRMLLTGTAQLDVVVKAVNQGQVQRFFTKPCDDAELIVAIRETLAEKDERARQTPAAPAPSKDAKPTEPAPLPTKLKSMPTPPAPATRSIISLDSSDESEDVDQLLADIKRSLDDLST